MVAYVVPRGYWTFLVDQEWHLNDISFREENPFVCFDGVILSHITHDTTSGGADSGGAYVYICSEHGTTKLIASDYVMKI